MSPVTFLEKIYALSDSGYVEGAADLMIDHIDRLMCDGKFSELDQILGLVDVDRLDRLLLCSWLSFTMVAKDQLPSRPALFVKIQSRMLRDRGPEKTAKILRNLQ